MKQVLFLSMSHHLFTSVKRQILEGLMKKNFITKHFWNFSNYSFFQLLDACVNNCGKEFRLEVASREFETEFRRLLSRSQPKVQEKLRGVLKSWAEGEFKGDSQLSLIPCLYTALKKEGVDFSSTSDPPKKSQSLPKDPNVVSSQQEEDDIARAIQLSLQDSKGYSLIDHSVEIQEFYC